MKKAQLIQRNFRSVSTLLEKSSDSTREKTSGYLPSLSLKPEEFLPSEFLRTQIKNFPNLSEIEVVRHFTQLSQFNYGVDEGCYPLGSCTMKYNPKINEQVAMENGFLDLHPMTPERYCQGSLAMMFELQEALMAITGMKGCSLHAAAGAHGELVGVKMIRAFHKKNRDTERKIILVPDSAHGTNPASASLCGFEVRQIHSNSQGMIEVESLKQQMDDSVAGLMITVPNTLGIFEENIIEISKLVHERGGLVYCDGANLNALVGKVDFYAMGVDAMHINLHKTFSTPHGGGGPGAGPVVISERLKDFLPIPVVRYRTDQGYYLDEGIPNSIGRFRCFHGNFSILVRALCYIYAFGNEHLKEISEGAVLKANYVKSQLKDHYFLPIDRPSLHEVVFSDKWQEANNHVTTLDIAKRLMDYGFHPPTIYFPLVIKGALMIEPTETEPKAELDRFVSAMVQIAKEAKENPQRVKEAPHQVGFKRMDEVRAARKPVLTWNPEEETAEKE